MWSLFDGHAATYEYFCTAMFYSHALLNTTGGNGVPDSPTGRDFTASLINES